MKKTILLVCAAGMSTSLMVTKMKKAAESEGFNYDIYAVSAADAESELETTTIDVLLLSPQIKFMKHTFEETAEKYNVMVAVISMHDYGIMNGKNVLKTAQEML